MVFYFLVLYAIIYLIGSGGTKLLNRTAGRTVIKNFRLVGFIFLLVATVCVGALVRSKAPAGASDAVVGEVVGELAIGPAVMVALIVVVAAWWRNRKTV